ncbi:histidine kinase [Roseiflexus castenholzii]|uniref:histidine kinase n=1 Tax=Roseiflexus castenholzii (strain DSM 13941 / HLO8) TaxID=383372 RepID=A7NRQ7_ROSCS|nr:histidine kinase [Roseiflexus castenholzii]ABU60253.1 integral membrane sensor signal transduction histidine kinase [Roseiflexus castenholzii DSM 13941]
MVRFNRISAKIAAGVMAFVLLLALVTGALVWRGFHQAEQAAAQRSADSLQTQSRNTLIQLTAQEAQLYDLELQQAARATKIAADFMAQARASGKTPDASAAPNVVYQAAQLTLSDNGLLYYDANPKRRTEILHIGSIPPDEVTDRSLRDSAILEDLFPSLLAQTETGVGIYFQGPQLTFRYYPVRGLPELELQNGAAEAAQTARIEDFLVAPNNNPQRKTVWLPPYLDDAGQGLLVSADTPIYYGDEFQGFIGIDVSLTRLIERLSQLKPTPGSFAFLLDSEGRLIAVPDGRAAALANRPLSAQEQAANGLLGAALTELNTELALALQAAQPPDALEISLNGQPVIVTRASLPNLGWTLSIVVPLAEVTAESQSVARAIEADAIATVRNTLLIMALFFIGAAAVTLWLSQRFLARPMTDMLSGVRAITAGNLDVSVPVTSNDELGELAASFNQMTDELNRRTRELAQTSAELQLKETQVKMAALEERQRLARELHDSVSQALYGIALGARTAQTQLERDPARLGEPLEYILSLAEAGLSEMRALIFELRPESLQTEGLVAALTKQSDALRARHKLDVVTRFDPEPEISLEAKEALYRIAQEAMHNVARHAHATRVELSLLNADGALTLEIRDNGKGFDPAQPYPGHLGLKSMPERAAHIGGAFHIESRPGAGTVITVTVPNG